MIISRGIKIRLAQLRKHRLIQYEHALDRLIAGTGYPATVAYRWCKLKEVK